MWVSFSLEFSTCHFPYTSTSSYSMLLSWYSQLLRDRSAISGSSKSLFGARVLAVGFNSSRPNWLIVVHLHTDRNWIQQSSNIFFFWKIHMITFIYLNCVWWFFKIQKKVCSSFYLFCLLLNIRNSIPSKFGVLIYLRKQ